jgi:hypothetical protein
MARNPHGDFRRLWFNMAIGCFNGPRLNTGTRAINRPTLVELFDPARATPIVGSPNRKHASFNPGPGAPPHNASCGAVWRSQGQAVLHTVRLWQAVGLVRFGSPNQWLWGRRGLLTQTSLPRLILVLTMRYWLMSFMHGILLREPGWVNEASDAPSVS